MEILVITNYNYTRQNSSWNMEYCFIVVFWVEGIYFFVVMETA